jgi:hypothetical protein
MRSRSERPIGGIARAWGNRRFLTPVDGVCLTRREPRPATRIAAIVVLLAALGGGLWW